MSATLPSNKTAFSSVVNVQAEETDEDSREKSKEEYLLLLAAFLKLLHEIEWRELVWEDLEEIIELRVSFLIGFALEGFGLDIDRGLDLVRNYDGNDLTPAEREQRKIIVDVIDNLVDFGVAEEYQMFQEVSGLSVPDEAEQVFEKYNLRYASQENEDVHYAMGIASAWCFVPEFGSLTYTTQGDERVRDTHRALEGLTFSKRNFPEWLVPPIDWGCRCYLVESYSPPSVMDAEELDEKMAHSVNPVFQESVVHSGHIFSAEHPYFTVPAAAYSHLRAMANRIKSKYFYEEPG